MIQSNQLSTVMSLSCFIIQLSLKSFFIEFHSFATLIQINKSNTDIIIIINNLLRLMLSTQIGIS